MNWSTSLYSNGNTLFHHSANHKINEVWTRYFMISNTWDTVKISGSMCLATIMQELAEGSLCFDPIS